MRAAIERFDLEDDDSEVLYDISILDYETGMNHGVKVIDAIYSCIDHQCYSYRVLLAIYQVIPVHWWGSHSPSGQRVSTRVPWQRWSYRRTWARPCSTGT